MPAGRPTKLTAEIRRVIVTAMENGNYVDTACLIANINRDTFYEWCKRGKAEESGEYREFTDAINKAIAKAESEAVKTIRKQGAKNWTALAWWLERRHRKRWAKNTDLNPGQIPPQQPMQPPIVTQRQPKT